MDEKRREEMKKYAGPTQPSMLRRSDEHDYSSQCFYLITLTTEGRRPLLGQLTGKANAPDGSAEAPRIVLTELGLAVAQEWSGISSKFPQVAVIAPWPHQNRRIPLTRNMCLNLNSMAKAICEY